MKMYLLIVSLMNYPLSFSEGLFHETISFIETCVRYDNVQVHVYINRSIYSYKDRFSIIQVFFKFSNTG